MRNTLNVVSHSPTWYSLDSPRITLETIERMTARRWALTSSRVAMAPSSPTRNLVLSSSYNPTSVPFHRDLQSPQRLLHADVFAAQKFSIPSCS